MSKPLIIIIFLLALISCKQKSEVHYFVSPNGNDLNSGTIDKPFLSLKMAQEAARETSGAVTIFLREGTYYLSEPIVFTSKDSRKNGSTLSFKNYQDEKVQIKGSKLITPNWNSYKNGIYQTKVPRGLKFDELFVDGVLQHMARYPNYDANAKYLNGTSGDAISKARVEKWNSPEGGYVHALHKSLWGGYHYLITGKTKDNNLQLEGGWQNNRPSGMHDKYRFVENIFEELDDENEWFFDTDNGILYFLPSTDVDLNSAVVEIPQIAHLFEFRGTEENPVRNISIEGVSLSQTLRTFMETKEPLLRSDWTIYRGGAVLFDGSESCRIGNCKLTNLGGNAVFFSNYNRDCEVSGCLISDIGASAVCFVGDPKAVRSPSFRYGQFVALDTMDLTPGPKSNNYPSSCKVYNNLMYDLGLVEKQSAGVEISMSMDITVSHNTIYDVPRAGINVSEGTWGGHIIEYNDVFNTVKETGDHGSFNSWGRDRFWHPNRKLMDSIVENSFDLTMLDVIKPVTIRNNRMRCDHGWDIDLDDGSSNYIIYNNLCLKGGLKLREGVNRTVYNNVIINNSFHPHVWFTNSNDVFTKNIVTDGYHSIQIKNWGKEVDYNVFPDSTSLQKAHSKGTDEHSVYGDPLFVNPLAGDFSVKEGSPALEVGFKNFSMDDFGVVSPVLKSMAKKVEIPLLKNQFKQSSDAVINFKGAVLKNLSTPGEQSATGMSSITGVLVIDIKKDAKVARYLQANDVILNFNSVKTNSLVDFRKAEKTIVNTSNLKMTIFRNQKEMNIELIID